MERIVHISIVNNAPDSPFEYFRGKAIIEDELRTSGISHTLLRPALLFGQEDILVNNIAWALRRFPAFIVFGRDTYRLQPIHVDDLARLAVEQGRSRDNRVIEAIGPQTFTFRGLVKEIAAAIGKSRPILGVHPELGYWLTRAVGWAKGDVIRTRNEIRGFMAELLYVNVPPTGWTRLSDWARRHSLNLGLNYQDELQRRLRR